MNSESNDDDEEETEVFLIANRKYQDFSKTVNFFQKDLINNDPEMYSEVAVMATRKFQMHPTNGFSHYITNYSSDVRPYNKVGPLFKGSKLINPKPGILWRKE